MKQQVQAQDEANEGLGKEVKEDQERQAPDQAGEFYPDRPDYSSSESTKAGA
jgi:hypothetical protein